jgi:hypothetical protein
MESADARSRAMSAGLARNWWMIGLRGVASRLRRRHREPGQEQRSA